MGFWKTAFLAPLNALKVDPMPSNVSFWRSFLGIGRHQEAGYWAWSGKWYVPYFINEYSYLSRPERSDARMDGVTHAAYMSLPPASPSAHDTKVNNYSYFVPGRFINFSS